MSEKLEMEKFGIKKVSDVVVQVSGATIERVSRTEQESDEKNEE